MILKEDMTNEQGVIIELFSMFENRLYMKS